TCLSPSDYLRSSFLVSLPSSFNGGVDTIKENKLHAHEDRFLNKPYEEAWCKLHARRRQFFCEVWLSVRCDPLYGVYLSLDDFYNKTKEAFDAELDRINPTVADR
ncbi:hypothetical protein L915_06576, partial [Phytophthora nicotianae]